VCIEDVNVGEVQDENAFLTIVHGTIDKHTVCGEAKGPNTSSGVIACDCTACSIMNRCLANSDLRFLGRLDIGAGGRVE